MNDWIEQNTLSVILLNLSEKLDEDGDNFWFGQRSLLFDNASQCFAAYFRGNSQGVFSGINRTALVLFSTTANGHGNKNPIVFVFDFWGYRGCKI
jgi:hypothetical protein